MIKKAAIIGGGISGLAAALFALRKGYAVELYEKEDRLGGFAAAFDFDGLSIEKYYHFICGGDTRLISLVEELGLGPALRFRPVTTANFYQGRLFDFASPFDLLAFRPMPLLSRLRFGWHISTAKYLKNWSSLDRMTAKAWLCRRIGLRAYQAVWEPLLNIKFGPYAEHISAAWIWHRIHRAASSRKHLLSREKRGIWREARQRLSPLWRPKSAPAVDGFISAPSSAEYEKMKEPSASLFVQRRKPVSPRSFWPFPCRLRPGSFRNRARTIVRNWQEFLFWRSFAACFA
jgi:protoporphyrinogen oxidase